MNEIERITRKHFMIFPPYDFSKSVDRHWNSLLFLTARQADSANLPANEDDFTSFTRLGPLPNHPEFIFPKNDRAFHAG
jgi:hypothetical protein